MSLASADLPSDPKALREFALACQSELAATSSELAAKTAELQAAMLAVQLRTLEIDKLKFQLAKLRRMQFGRSSERLTRQIEQLELRLEELEAGEAPPAAVYFYSPDRGGEHPAAHLANFHGFLQADGYAGFAALYEPKSIEAGATPTITEVACWAHCRRAIFDIWETTKSPVAKVALDRIAEFYAIEDKARFAPPAERLAHRAALIPLLDAFFTWAQATERKLSAPSELAKALRYIITRRTALTLFATDARLEADNNIAENGIRRIALGRRNWLFAGSDAGGERAAAVHSILQTCKLNNVNPQAYLSDTLAKIADGHPINRIAELMPWAHATAARPPPD